MKNVYKWYAISNKLYKMKIPILPKLITNLIRLVFGCYIPCSCEIGENTKIGYGGIGVVVHARAVVGKNSVISQCVTIGGTSKKYGVPRIGNNVYIGSGAKLLGPITIGNNVVIGANSVVTKNVESNCLVAGIPAKVIKQDIKIEEYI